MRRFRKVRHVPLPLLAVIMAAILFAELARCEREGAKETAAEAEKSVPRRAALTFDDGPNACYTPEVLRALGAAKEKGASTILFTSRSSSDYDAFCDEVLLLAVKEHLKNGGAISPQFPILVMIDVLYSHFLTTDSERKEALYEYAVTKLHET